jgi:hypothetical protein
MPGTGAPVGRDAHLGDHPPTVVRRVAREHPCGQAGFLMPHRPDDDVAVVDRLHEVVDRGAERPGQPDELVQVDAAVTGLDPAQRRRADVAPVRERVEAPAAGPPQTADALADDVGQLDRWHGDQATARLAKTA